MIYKLAQLFSYIFCLIGSLSLFLQLAAAVDISLEWNPPTENEDGSDLSSIAKYRLYYGTTPGVYQISFDLGQSSYYTVIGLDPERDYYFALKTLSESGVESDLSEEVLAGAITTSIDPSDLDGDGINNSLDLDDDQDGLLDIEEPQYGTDPNKADTDGDGVIDGQEVLAGTNPLDAGDFRLVIRETTCLEWNSFLGGMWNFFEHSNRSLETREITTTLFDSAGIPQGTESFSLQPGEQFDLAVHDMEGFEVDQYGKICSNQNGSPGDIDGRMLYYKPDNIGGYQFGFALQMTNGKPGKQWIPFNSFHPENLSFLAANWIQITNLGDKEGRGQLRFYDQLGNLLAEDSVFAPIGTRVDLSAHRFGPSIVGLVEWVPETTIENVPFIIRNVRYLYDNPGAVNSFSSAVQLEASKGTSQKLVLPLNTINRSSIIELVNVSEETVQANVELFENSAQDSVYQRSIVIASKASFHLITDSLLGIGREGLAVVRSSTPNSLLAVGMFYGRSPSNSIDYIYAIPARTKDAAESVGNYNTFINQNSWLTLANSSAIDSSVGFSMNGEEYLRTIPAFSTLTERLNTYVGADVNGVVRLQSSSESDINAWVTRARTTDFVIPIPLR